MTGANGRVVVSQRAQKLLEPKRGYGIYIYIYLYKIYIYIYIYIISTCALICISISIYLSTSICASVSIVLLLCISILYIYLHPYVHLYLLFLNPKNVFELLRPVKCLHCFFLRPVKCLHCLKKKLVFKKRFFKKSSYFIGFQKNTLKYAFSLLLASESLLLVESNLLC